MFFRGRRSRQIKTVARIALVFGLLSGASVCGQTVSDLSAKYPAVSAYEVRPGVLMTAKYAVNGQVCEMLLQRHYSPNQPDADTTIPAKLERELIDELAPEAERGPTTSTWLRNSFTAGGVSHIERDFVNVLVVIDGTYWCTDDSDGKANCGHGGTKVITIRWKNRTCASGKPIGSGKSFPDKDGELGRAR
jgi:hypothetical protein